MKKIIYEEETGIAVMTTTGELTVEKTALKDVPYGRKFKIIDASDLPQDRTFRGAWEFDFSKNYDNYILKFYKFGQYTEENIHKIGEFQLSLFKFLNIIKSMVRQDNGKVGGSDYFLEVLIDLDSIMWQKCLSIQGLF